MENNIKRWLNKEIITKEQADKLSAEYTEESNRRRKERIKVILYVLSSIFLGIGVISFVAANDWLMELILKFYGFKIFVLTALTISCLYIGYLCKYEKGKDKLGGSLIFLSTILIGSTYALIGQVYHSEANTSTLFLLWLISILPLAYFYKSKAINVLSIILLFTASSFFMSEQIELLYYFGEKETVAIIPFLISIILYSVANMAFVRKKYTEFSMSYKFYSILSILLTLFLLIVAEFKYVDGFFTFATQFLIIMAVLINLAIAFSEKDRNKLFIMEEVGLFVLSFMILYIPEILLSRFFIILLYFTIIVLMFYFGYKKEDSTLINSSIIFLILFTWYRFFDSSWSFLIKSLFFVSLGGIILSYIYLSEKYLPYIKNKKWKINAE